MCECLVLISDSDDVNRIRKTERSTDLSNTNAKKKHKKNDESDTKAADMKDSEQADFDEQSRMQSIVMSPADQLFRRVDGTRPRTRWTQAIIALYGSGIVMSHSDDVNEEKER